MNHTQMRESGATVARSLAEVIAAAARVALPIIAAVVALAAAVNAGLTIARLFERIGADLPAQILAAASSVGVLCALVGVLTLARSANLRALSILYTIAWLPLVLVLVALEAALSSAIVAVPMALTESGRTVAALLAGLALMPVATLAVASRRQDPGDVRLALGYYVGNMLKVVLLVATAGANLAFGLARGVPLEVSLFVAIVLETGFVLSLARSNGHALHAGALVVFGAAIGVVAVETVATLSGLAALPELARIGEALYLTTPALAIAYIVLTALSERGSRNASAAPRIRILRGVAGGVRAMREDVADLRSAIRDAPALMGPGAQPRRITLADDAPASADAIRVPSAGTSAGTSAGMPRPAPKPIASAPTSELPSFLAPSATGATGATAPKSRRSRATPNQRNAP